MIAHIWSPILHDATLAAAWLDARVPATVPRWGGAALLVLVAAVIGRIGGRVLAGLVQLALLAAAVLVAWQMIRVPASVHAALPAACLLEGTCATSAPAVPSSGTGPSSPSRPAPAAAGGGTPAASIALAAVR